MTTGPIEMYLGQLRTKLEARFDSECADQLLSEIRSHLFDAAAELEEDGVSPSEAEKLSVARFGAPEKAAFLLPLGKQFGTGDRYWGRGAFWASMVAALGLTWYSLDPSGHRVFSRDELPPILALILFFYGFACWKAKSFSMIRQSAVVIALMLMVTGLFRVKMIDPAYSDSVADGFARLQVQRSLPRMMQASSLSSLADLGFRARTTTEPGGFGPILAADASPSLVPDPISEPKAPTALHGMVPIGINPWDLTREGLLPEVSQLLLTWLFLILMTNAGVCWVGCLEHEQKGGVLLLQ